jgi:hypothetical protein
VLQKNSETLETATQAMSDLWARTSSRPLCSCFEKILLQLVSTFFVGTAVPTAQTAMLSLSSSFDIGELSKQNGFEDLFELFPKGN